MTITASVFFMGEYRPAYFEAPTAWQAAARLETALAGVADYQWFADRIQNARQQIIKENCSAFADEHGCRGIAFAKRPHDPFLDSVTAKLPAYPGLDYSAAVNKAV